MSSREAPVINQGVSELYAAWIATHLTRLSDGHDPMGHLFGIERLARAARAERYTTPGRGDEVRLKP